MSDFDDDFDNFDDNDFNDFQSENSLKEAWQNSPLLKIFVIVGGIILLLAAFIIFTGGDEKVESRLANAPEDREILGGEISENYVNALEEVNEQRLNTAVQTGTSAIPMLINPEEQELLTPIDEAPPFQEFDPLATFRASVAPDEDNVTIDDSEPKLMAPEQIIQQQPVPVAAPNPQAIQALAEAMAEHVGGIIKKHDATAPQISQITPRDYYQQLALAEQQAQMELMASSMVDTDGDGIPDTVLNGDVTSADDSSDDIVTETIIVPSGTINYAQILTEANSDIPGPVLAQMVSGPLSGARLIGSFSVESKKIILSFNSIVIDGINQPISAIAIDPATTLPGVASDVDNRYWGRVILPAASRFLEGIGSAIAEDTQTTVTVSGDTVIEETDALDFEQEIGRGVEEGIGEIADFMDDAASTMQPLIRVHRGTAIGVFFTEPVLDLSEGQ